MAIRPRPAEQGFVLITALWLLLLCGAIVALMMLRNSSRAEASRDQADLVQAEFDVNAAVQTVAADILFRGQGSRWARLPTSDTVMVGDRQLQIELSSENSRYDLNSGDVDLISRGLMNKGISADQRAEFIQALLAFRAKEQLLADMSQAASLTSMLRGADVCPEQWFTIYSGLSAPREGKPATEIDVNAGSAVSSSTDQETASPGTALRLIIEREGAAGLVAVVRPGGTGRAAKVLYWTSSASCSPN